MAGRRGNGEGTIFQRPDGKWLAQGTVQLVGGGSKRMTVYGRTRAEAHSRLQERLGRDRAGYRSPLRERSLADFLDHWLTTVVQQHTRPTTAYDYENQVEKYLKPHLGRITLGKLTPQHVQQMVDAIYANTGAARTAGKARAVLRAALSHAERHEYVVRNVAKHVTLPRYEPKPITPWTPEQVRVFLESVADHRWYGAFLISTIYGARRGEVLGLCWSNVDFANNTIRFDQQLQRVNRDLQLGPVKTRAGQRTLPLAPVVRDELLALAATASNKPALNNGDGDGDLVFRAKLGTPIDPHVYTRAFHELRKKRGLPRIRLHDLRHTAATLFKGAGVPDRDIQAILGHANVTTTQQIYQHGDSGLQAEALHALGSRVTQQTAYQTAYSDDFSTGQGTNLPALTPGTPGWTRTNDTWFRRQSDNTFYNNPTPVLRGKANADDGTTQQQTADIFAALADLLKEYEPTDTDIDHMSCPLDHSTEWLVREIRKRLGIEIRAGPE